jgi:hypothetical protein
MTGITEIVEEMYFDKIKNFDKSYLQKETEQHWAIVHNVSVDLHIHHNIIITNYYVDNDFVYYQLAENHKNENRVKYFKFKDDYNFEEDIKIDYDYKKYIRNKKLNRILNND